MNADKTKKDLRKSAFIRVHLRSNNQPEQLRAVHELNPAIPVQIINLGSKALLER